MAQMNKPLILTDRFRYLGFSPQRMIHSTSNNNYYYIKIIINKEKCQPVFYYPVISFTTYSRVRGPSNSQK